MNNKLFTSILVTILISNCVHQPHNATNNSSTYSLNYFNYLHNTDNLKQRQIYNKINHWKLKSKIQILDLNTKKSCICYMYWEKIDHKSTIKLYSLFNLQSLTLESDNYNNKLNLKHNDLSNNNHDLDLNYWINSGLIKINDLNNWLIGLPNYKDPYKIINHGFIQNNWEITYANYTPSKSLPNLLFPKKIVITRIKNLPYISNINNNIPNIKLKIIVNSFNIIKI
jgi:outer membrane biogenesis lipoprotein LolB